MYNPEPYIKEMQRCDDCPTSLDIWKAEQCLDCDLEDDYYCVCPDRIKASKCPVGCVKTIGISCGDCQHLERRKVEGIEP